MQDAVYDAIENADSQGKYINADVMGEILSYFHSGELRVRAATAISSNVDEIIKQAVDKSLLYTEHTQPGGNIPLFCHFPR